MSVISPVNLRPIGRCTRCRKNNIRGDIFNNIKVYKSIQVQPSRGFGKLFLQVHRNVPQFSPAREGLRQINLASKRI